MPPNEENPSGVVGKQIGNYKATKLLGKGSMGEVYEAAHPILDKQVAIKSSIRGPVVLPRAGVAFQT